MRRTWQLQEAKNKLSEVVQDALDHGPQIITRRGVDSVVVIAYSEYQKMRLHRGKLSDFFRASPLMAEELDLTRDTSVVRDDIAL
jgi:antitoxin Phd